MGEYLDGWNETMGEEPEPPPSPVGRFGAVAGAALVLAVVAGGGWMWGRHLERQARAHAAGEAIAAPVNLDEESGESEYAPVDASIPTAEESDDSYVEE